MFFKLIYLLITNKLLSSIYLKSCITIRLSGFILIELFNEGWLLDRSAVTKIVGYIRKTSLVFTSVFLLLIW